MPKKRSTTWSRSKKEKQIITTRLIAISLKVEDCVYKQKPISEWEAKQYIREVSSYKIQCSQDERSLQVIEKITRCMKAIILDHQEPQIHTINEESSIPAAVVRAGSISPVYSIPEEDRYQLTQITEVPNDNIEIIDLSNIDADDDDPMHNETNTGTADYAGSKVTVEVDIHRGMSSLSLRDSGEPLDIAMSTETNCSQSILNNFDGIEQMPQNMINITSQRAVANGLVDNVTCGRNTTNLTQFVGNYSVEKPNKNVKSIIAPMKPVIIWNDKNNLKLNKVVNNKEPIKVTNAASYTTNALNQQNNNIVFETINASETNCSQSILNNFDSVEKMQQNTNNITSQRVSAHDLVSNVTAGRKTTNLTRTVGNNSVDKPVENAKTTIGPSKPIIISVAKNNLKINTVVQNKEPMKVTSNTFNQKNNKIIFKPVTSNIPESQRQTWYDSNRTYTINDFSHSIKYNSNFAQARQIYNDDNKVTDKNAGILNENTPRNTSYVAEKENQPIKYNVNSKAPLCINRPMSATAVIKENTATTKKKRGPKKKPKDEKEIKQKNKRVSRVPKSNKDITTKNKMIPIYNTNVVDDLSWIENIRYVREIRAEENDTTLHLEESFWDNFYLPGNWTENDFV